MDENCVGLEEAPTADVVGIPIAEDPLEILVETVTVERSSSKSYPGDAGLKVVPDPTDLSASD